MPLYVQNGKLLQKSGALGTSVGCCCGGSPNCYTCNSIATRGFGGVCNYETTTLICPGDAPSPVTRGEACDCIGNNSVVKPCSQWNIPETAQYSNCSCVELQAQCEAWIYGGNCDGCTMYRSVFRVVKTLFYFDGGTCVWTKLAQTSDVSTPIFFQTGNCEGVDPPTQYPDCTPPACNGPYNPNGCAGCNPLP